MSSSHFLIGLFVFLILSCLSCHSFNGSGVENPPAMQETRETCVRSLVWKDPLEEEMATHSSVLAWKIPWSEKPGGLQSMVRKRLDTTERLTHTQAACIFSRLILCQLLHLLLFSSILRVFFSPCL